MPPALRQIEVERLDDVCCVRLRQRRLDELAVLELADDVLRLIDDGDCRRLVFSLGPDTPECLYSVFLTKLVTIQRHLMERGGKMVLCDATPEVLEIFQACRLRDHFKFAPDREAAVAALRGGA